ncbi:Ig-like domain-containing protein [Bacillus sp. EAC]|uniref:Ig-like domain-containing protein n=1 Tax=Bacillus sp. EAC TaxID=1978338 RepID=UPI000B43DDBF|nr:Ig-like domain-containing protein [Bacillus sp. EAC]
MKVRKEFMSLRMKQTRRILSISAMSAMLLNVALPYSSTLAHAEVKQNQQAASSGKFNADEVNRILAGLTSEQKENINKLTGADIANKIRVGQKDLTKKSNIQVIVQFKTDPAKIQIIKNSLEKGMATANTQAFASEYTAAQQKVKDAHTAFQSFVNKQAKTQIVGGKQVETKMSITTQYTDAFNGVALTLPGNQVAKLAENPEVASVWPVVEYTVSESGNASQTSEPGSVGKPTGGLSLMGVDKLQAEGYTGIIKKGPRMGQKVKVGVLDTGIDYNHPDLYKVTHDANGNLYEGHDFANPTLDAQGNIVLNDDHDPMETIYPDWVKAKDNSNPSPVDVPAPADYKHYITSHGTHVSGTIAANTTNNNGVYSANGMAPDVELHGYRVLGPGGSGLSDSVLKGIDQAVIDHMDVINLSLGANQNDPLYPTSIAITNATLAGVTCSVSAGNSGPGVATVGSPGTSPLAITVGASTIPEEIPVMTIKNGNSSYQSRLFGKSFVDADDALKGQTLPIVDVGLGSATDFQEKDVKGKIVLVHRGGEFLQTKMANAHNAGVKAMIIWDNQDDTETQGYIPNFLGVSQDNVYSISLTQAQGSALSNAIKADPDNATVTFPTTLDTSIKKDGDELASFSSTGPVKDWTIKPDVIAPGVDIMSTAPYDIWESQDKATHNYDSAYQSMSGTSMAAPHTTGAIALVIAAHPDYTPADVKTALMNTAKDVNTDSKTYSIYQVGAGRIDPVKAIKTDVKVQVVDKATTLDGSNALTQIDQITGSIFFGYKGRGDGATNGTDDVVSSKDFNIVNQGNSSKTFKVSTQFLSTKFAQSNKVGPGTGNDVKVDFSVGGSKVTSINVGGNSTEKTTATITVPSNALDGTYEGYINVVNAADASETYRIPFTITVAEKGIDSFKVNIKATPVGNLSAYSFSVNNEMENIYVVLKDKDGKYIGVTNTLRSGSNFTPGIHYGPIITLFNGGYLPFTKDYDGTYDQSGISSKLAVLPEGAYSLEMIATDKIGKRYTAEDTVYVDGTPPTMKMDNDSKGGIYEIDTAGYLPGQEIKGFYGTVYDSNIDVMKNNSETSVPSPNDGVTPVPVDQGLNHVFGYQDSYNPTVIFNTDEKGRFHFGVTAEDVANKMGSEFIINPVDYSGEEDYDTKKETYYFIKKGTPYLTLTSSNGVDAGPGNDDKLVVDSNKPFKATIATKYGIGMNGATITLNDQGVYKFSNIRLTDEYKNYLLRKGMSQDAVDHALTVGQPYKHPVYQVGQNTDVTISGNVPVLDHDMNIIEADVTFSSPDPIVGPFPFIFLKANLTLSGEDTKVAWFPTNTPNVRQSISVLRGRVAAESFARNNINNNYPQFTVDSGAKVTVRNDEGKSFTTDNPTSFNNTMAYTFINPYYAVTMDVSDKPYSVEASVPGHFKGYAKTPVIGENKYGYNSGTIKDLPGLFPILLGGDVNGDNVIDMKDLTAEANAWSTYNGQANPTAKKAWLNDPVNRNNDIYWIPTTNPSGWGIDYNDFYFIFKNFGAKNQSAIDAGLTVANPQETLTADTMVNGVQLHAGDGLKEVKAALNFAGPAQKTFETTIPKLQELQNGSTISLIPQSTVFVDDQLWRKAITQVMLGSTDVTSSVTISPGYQYADQLGAAQTMPSKITLPGSLFTATTTTNYTVTIKATGYQNVTNTFTVSAVPIPTPTIPLVTDPAKAHLGKDLTFTFPEDANWRQGINNIKVKTLNSALVDVPQQYYDISVPGQITFKADLFKTDASPVGPTSVIKPGGTNWLPQLYKFDISSIGADNTIYPTKSVGVDSNGSAAQAVGYGITFDTQGGAPVSPIAIGYKPASTKINGDVLANQAIIGGFKNPATTRPGYVLIGWFTDQAGTTQWQPGNNVSTDQTVYAKWQMNATQNYSLVDADNSNGPKFDGSLSVSGNGWVLGEGDLKITIPDYVTTIPWLTDKTNISKIEATYYKMNNDGSTDTNATTYTLDSSTYKLTAGANNTGILSFTTATHDQAVQAGQTTLGEKFAFSEMPTIANLGNIKGYKVTLTATTGETVTIPDIKLGYRRHIDLNGGTLKTSNDSFLADQLVNTKASAPTMSNVPSHVTKGSLTAGPYLYLDAAGSSDKKSAITDGPILLTDNAIYYLGWIKVPPTVSKDTIGNIVGSDITLPFTDDGIWKNNIKEVKIGSKTLVLNTDYTMTDKSIILNRNLFTIGQKVNVTIVSEGYQDAIVSDQVIGYTVTFESNGGDPVPAQIVDRSATKPTEPAKVGFKFYGWYSDQNLTTPYDFTNIVTKPITLYAKYALAGSVVTPDTTDNALGNNMALEFSDNDWAKAISSIAINGITVDKTKVNVDTVNRTITLDKSLFTRVRDYMILIKATDYADATVTQKVVNGNNIHFVLPSDAPTVVKAATKDLIVVRRITEPVAYGYDLTWFADEACTIPWDFTNSIYSARTLYGKWSVHKFTVIFDLQDFGFVFNTTADYNTTITAQTPIRTGYTFLGWYKDAAGRTAWNFATDKVTENTVLYAKWSINSYTVTFNSNGGSTVSNKTANYDTVISAPTAPTRPGYTFFGWYKDVAGQFAWNFATDKVTNNVSIYAKWSLNRPIINTIDDNDTTISGKTVANATVVVKNNGVEVASGKANAEGNYSLNITPQKAGAVLTVIATDAAGNQSEATSITVLDHTAPKAPIINTIDDNDKTISGKTEANATVVVKNHGVVAGTGKANAEGNFSLEIATQKAGTVLTVIATDEAGNQSEASITVLDRTAPNAPIIHLIDDNDTKITGITEANATIIVKNKGTLVATGKADSKGLFSIKINHQKAGTELSVTASDLSGNVSTSTKVKVQDKTAPNGPKISKIILKNKNEIQITGTAEAYSTITVKIGNKVVANVKVTSKGTFTVKLSKVSKGKNNITLYAIDKAGNKSAAVTRSLIIK